MQLRKGERYCHQKTVFLAISVENVSGIPWKEFDSANFYENIYGRNCENVIGYCTVPIGVVGPLKINGKDYTIPFATTEGALIASTNRGARAVRDSDGMRSIVVNDGMTRAPVIQCPSLEESLTIRRWIESEGLSELKTEFEKTTSHGKLEKIHLLQVGRYLHLRISCKTGNAMGMNMVTKGSQKVVEKLKEKFPEISLVTLSGNTCTDKKPTAINWILGRGKSVISEVLLKKESIERVLKTNINALYNMNVRSAIAGSIGGFNAHSANIVAGIFLATGQDIAQVVESSNCITTMEIVDEDLLVSCSMPSLEVGTIGGGTQLPSQLGCTKLLNLENGDESNELAKVICSTVLCGELSLLSAQCSGDVVSAHMKLNRKK